jgi:hypothetical protein
MCRVEKAGLFTDALHVYMSKEVFPALGLSRFRFNRSVIEKITLSAWQLQAPGFFKRKGDPGADKPRLYGGI